MKRIFTYLMIALVLSMSSCLFENDMSYPDIPADIIAFEVEGQKSVNIDTEKRTVEIVLNEVVDMSYLKVENIQVSEEAEIVGGIPEHLDLTDTLELNVRTYVDNIWTVTATQPIARYITVENQVGEAELDLSTRSAIVYVSETQLLAKVRFLEVKLEPEGSVVRTTTGAADDGSLETLACSFPMTLDCVHRRSFLISHEGNTYEWTLKVLKKKVNQQHGKN